MKPSTIKSVLETPYWIPSLDVDTSYTRVHDDHDGTFEGKLIVSIDRQGDIWFTTDRSHFAMLRFRTWGGGGASPRTRNALMLLAEAIRLDNEEKPQPE